MKIFDNFIKLLLQIQKVESNKNTLSNNTITVILNCILFSIKNLEKFDKNH